MPSFERSKSVNQHLREIIQTGHRSYAPKPGFHWNLTARLLGFKCKYRDVPDYRQGIDL